jgi:hypothetical protein
MIIDQDQRSLLKDHFKDQLWNDLQSHVLELFRQNPARPISGETPSSREWSRRKPGRSETPEQLGAPSLGSGIFQTPPNRYPPARPLQLLAEAIPV